MGHKAIAPAVVAELMKMESGQRFSADELAARLHKTPEQVANVITGRIRDGRLQAEVILRGHVWVYRGMTGTAPAGRSLGPVVGVATEATPAGGTGEIRLNGHDPAMRPDLDRKPAKKHSSPAVHGPACYTLVRELKNGTLLLEDGYGELYKAVRI